MSELTDPIMLFALARLVEGATIAVAAGVSMWSRRPSRRAAARRLIRALRGPGAGVTKE